MAATISVWALRWGVLIRLPTVRVGRGTERTAGFLGQRCMLCLLLLLLLLLLLHSSRSRFFPNKNFRESVSNFAYKK
jgi:hypothetical protein